MIGTVCCAGNWSTLDQLVTTRAVVVPLLVGLLIGWSRSRRPKHGVEPAAARGCAGAELRSVLNASAEGAAIEQDGGLDAPFRTPYVRRAHDVQLRQVVDPAVGGRSRRCSVTPKQRHPQAIAP